jgi:thiol:disulfide interchange protein DsbG
MLEKQGVKIHGPLETPSGLDAFAASVGTKPMAIYIAPDANYALIGTMIDVRGKPVGEEKLRQIVSRPLEEQAWASLEAARWVQDGDPRAPRVVYAFMDANCPFCHEFWRSARPWVEAGKVQIRHVMVGIIRPDSPTKAAAILEADNPGAALDLNARSYDGGGIKPLNSISAATSTALTSNAELMKELGFSGTPGIVGKADDGSLIFRSGAPRGASRKAILGPL